MDEDALNETQGYWIYANQSGNLTLPGVGGSKEDVTTNWADLIFRNSSMDELSPGDAVDNGWVDWVEKKKKGIRSEI